MKSENNKKLKTIAEILRLKKFPQSAKILLIIKKLQQML